MARSGIGDARRLTDIVSRLRRELRRGVRDELPWESLPMAQIELLQVLAEADQLRIGELAATRRLEPHTVSGLVQQLVATGLARRMEDPADRRAALVSITTHGRRQLNQWQQANTRLVAAAFRRLNAEQRAAIRTALPALNALADALADPPH